MPLCSKSRNRSQAASNFGACAVAKRMECVELAPAFNGPRRSRAGASSTHSIRFARFGCGVSTLWALLISLLFSGMASAVAGDGSTPAPETRSFPPALHSYGDGQLTSLWAVLENRVRQEPFNL